MGYLTLQIGEIAIIVAQAEAMAESVDLQVGLAEGDGAEEWIARRGAIIEDITQITRDLAVAKARNDSIGALLWTTLPLVVIGMIQMYIGFWRWQTRVQNHLDAILRSQARSEGQKKQASHPWMAVRKLPPVWKKKVS